LERARRGIPSLHPWQHQPAQARNKQEGEGYGLLPVGVIQFDRRLDAGPTAIGHQDVDRSELLFDFAHEVFQFGGLPDVGRNGHDLSASG
jgi:hypothetical protein